MMEQHDDLAQLLPEDVLADVLRRLAPRYLAASRGVCRAWRAIIDARRLLRQDLLPHSLGAIIINYHDLASSEFLSRPSTGPTASAHLDYLPYADSVHDHCNGLLLLHNLVVNPATRWWAQLPPRPHQLMAMEYFYNHEYLVFDPTLSQHYEVFLVPRVMSSRSPFPFQSDPKIEESEWPPSPCILQVFSSRTNRWEERSFVRDGEAAGTVADMQLSSRDDQRCGVHWRGALYVHCQPKFVMRISLSNDKYQVIKPPTDVELSRYSQIYLGKSEKGVYCASLLYSYLEIWILDESYGQMDWVLKHRNNLKPMQACRNYHQQNYGPWILSDFNYSKYRQYCHGFGDHDEDENSETIVENKFEWDSDNDNVINTKDTFERWRKCRYTFLGFHPYKEVVFLSESLSRGLAYHLNSSKVQDLGNICPKLYTALVHEPFIEASFPYTPCWM